MAPTFRHGKKTGVLIDQFHFSEYLNDCTVSASVDMAETTTYRKDDKTYVPGLRQATFGLKGLFATSGSSGAGASTNIDSIAEYFDDALGGSSNVVCTVVIDSTAVGSKAYLMKADPMAWDVSAPAQGIVSCEAQLQASDGYRSGKLLRWQVASTSTGSQSAVSAAGTTAAGGTTGGGVGHLHVTAVSSTFGSATFKIQHSTSGSTWADLITFTAATAQTFQRSTVAGTVKERVRATLSSYTSAGTSDTVTASIAFARRSGFAWF